MNVLLLAQPITFSNSMQEKENVIVFSKSLRSFESVTIVQVN